jgi:predicted site-specific integrase-resolvase
MSTAIIDERLYRMREFCAIARITTHTGYAWVREGKVEAVRVAGRIRIPESAIEKIILPARKDSAE